MWTANTDTMAMSHYPGAPCREIVAIGGQAYALTDEGVVRLSESDSSESIDACVEWDATDMGADVLKRLSAAYIAYRSTDAMAMTIGYSPDGFDERDLDLILPWRAADVVTEGRFKIGRGARSREFTFGFASIDGARFSLHRASIMADNTSRRI